MKDKLSVLFVLLLLVCFSGFAQEKQSGLAYMTSNTKYVDESESVFKTQVFNLGISVQQEPWVDDSPTIFFVNAGYEFRKLYDAYNFYWGVGPRLRVGWGSGDWGIYTWNKDYDFSFNSFAWGLSMIPSVGLILDTDYNLGLYLEGELGVLNYHTKAKIDPTGKLSTKNGNSYLNLNIALRGGLRCNLSSKIEGSVWGGLSNVSTNDMLHNIKFEDKRFEKYPLYTEVGIGIAF